MDKHTHAGHEGHGHSHPQSESKVSTDTAGLKDPVCGMVVDKATALSVLVLKERFGLQRATGAVIIVAGVIALRLS